MLQLYVLQYVYILTLTANFVPYVRVEGTHPQSLASWEISELLLYFRLTLRFLLAYKAVHHTAFGNHAKARAALGLGIAQTLRLWAFVHMSCVVAYITRSNDFPGTIAISKRARIRLGTMCSDKILAKTSDFWTSTLAIAREPKYP